MDEHIEPFGELLLRAHRIKDLLNEPTTRLERCQDAMLIIGGIINRYKVHGLDWGPQKLKALTQMLDEIEAELDE